MKNKKTFIALALLIAVLMLGIGYAAISNVALDIGGSAGTAGDADNFKVKFVNENIPTSGDGTVEATVTGDTTATINVSGMNAKGDSATAVYTIQNDSADLSAELSVATSSVSNEEYFKITTEIADPTTIAAGETTTVTVKIELIKTPIEDDITSDITVKLDAAPVQP